MNINGKNDSEFMWCYKCRDKGLNQQQVIQRLTEERERLIKFADLVIDMSWEATDIDGDDIQQEAINCGLLKQKRMTEPCSERCLCEEFDAQFPTMCYRKTYRQALKDK